MIYEKNGKWFKIPKPISLEVTIRNTLLNALGYTNGNQKEAARFLKISPRMVNYNMIRYRIPRPKDAK